MNRNLNDNEFDAMMKNYCRRTSQTAFDVEIENEKSSVSRMKWGAFAVPAVAVVLIFSFALVNIFGLSDKMQNNSKTPKGFCISASAAEREPVMLENVEVMLTPKDKNGLSSDIFFEDGDISLDSIWFNMSGENVETFDYKCEKGSLQYVIPDLKEEMLDGDDSITQDDYFMKGRHLENIPYDAGKSEYIFVGWYNLSIDEELISHFGKNFYEETSWDEIRSYRKELLKTEEDFNRYFSDTITITVHYKDGTSETAVIEITIDTWEDGDKTYGNYVLRYK